MENPTTTPAAAAPAEPHAPAPYMAVFAALFVLTLIEVGVAFVGFSRLFTVLSLVFLAVWKAVMVALYYMHLRYEPTRLRFLALVPLPLAVILVMAVLTEF